MDCVKSWEIHSPKKLNKKKSLRDLHLSGFYKIRALSWYYCLLFLPVEDMYKKGQIGKNTFRNSQVLYTEYNGR